MLRKFLVSIFFLASIDSLAQDSDPSVLQSEVTIQFNNVTLPTALRQLSRTSAVNFSYNSNIIPREARFSQAYKSAKLDTILNDLLSHANLYYREVGGTIVVLKRIFNERKIIGRVVDRETGSPLPFANVFIDNSTLGAPSNINGEFEIENIPDIGFNLVVSYVGYESKTISFNNRTQVENRRFVIEMDIDQKVLDNFNVVGKASRKRIRNRRRLVNRFRREFLGGSDNADKCRIINPDVLDFEILDSLGNFRVTAEDMLYVENYALGYRVGYLLDEFTFNNGLKMDIGQAQFRELESKGRRQYRKWEAARVLAYNGSYQHFLNSLISGTLMEEGFELNIVQYDSVTAEYTTPLNPPPVDEILQVTLTNEEFLYKLTANYDIEVTYKGEYEDTDYKKLFRSTSKSGNYKYTDKKARTSIALNDQQSVSSYQVFGVDLDEVELFQKSIIFFLEKETFIGFPGQFISPRDVIFGGWWGWGAFSDALPLNYRPY